jgi:ribosomal protein S18 acetylase RimI-like enzyme
VATVPETTVIRPFRSREHMTRVLQFQYEVYQRNFPGFVVGRAFLADYERQLRQAERSPVEGLWVLEEQGAVIGFVWAALMSTMVDPKVGYIKNVYVVPERRGQALAERLMEQAEQWMREHGVERSALDVTVSNRTAVGLYERCGYHVQRYRMEKDLGEKEPGL